MRSGLFLGLSVFWEHYGDGARGETPVLAIALVSFASPVQGRETRSDACDVMLSSRRYNVAHVDNGTSRLFFS